LEHGHRHRTVGQRLDLTRVTLGRRGALHLTVLDAATDDLADVVGVDLLAHADRPGVTRLGADAQLLLGADEAGGGIDLPRTIVLPVVAAQPHRCPLSLRLRVPSIAEEPRPSTRSGPWASSE